MTLVLATVHFEVMCEKICAIAVKVRLRIHEDRQGLTSNGLVPDPFSISCYVMLIRVSLLMMDTFGAGCCSRVRANVALLTLSILLLTSISQSFHLSLELSFLLSE